MKHIKLFENFTRLGTQPLSSKQLVIYKSYIKESYTYLNTELDLTDVLFDGFSFYVGDMEYDSIDQIILMKIEALMTYYGISKMGLNSLYNYRIKLDMVIK
jgi:hypothetical protein